METKTTPSMMPNSSPPEQGTVLASLKRNVLWGVLGLVALVFATVCVMYYTSRQSAAAAPADGTPAVSAETTTAPEAASSTGTAPSASNSVLAGATLPPMAELTAQSAPTTTVTPPAAEILPAPKPVTTATVPAAKPATKSVEKSVAKPATPAKTLDANNIPHGTTIYVVKSGDTFEKIARETCGDSHKWSRLVELNKDWVKDVNHLKVGQKILVERTINPRDYADY